MQACFYKFGQFLHETQSFQNKTSLNFDPSFNFGDHKIRFILRYLLVMLRFGFWMGAFGIPNLKSRSRGFGIGIFCLRLDRKIPKPRGSESGFEIHEKIPSKNLENPEIPGIGIGILKSLKKLKKSQNFKTSKKSRKSPIFFRGMGYPDKKPPLV